VAFNMLEPWLLNVPRHRGSLAVASGGDCGSLLLRGILSWPWAASWV